MSLSRAPCQGTREPDPEVATRDRGWLLRVLVLALVFAAFTLVRSARLDIPLRDPHGAFFLGRLVQSLGMFVLLAAIDAGVRVPRPSWTWGAVWRTLAQRWPVRRVALAFVGLLAYYVVYLSYRNLKSWDVFNTPRDAMLLQWDRVLFLGHSPAVLLHDLLGQHVDGYVLMVVYEAFPWLATLSIVAALVFTDRVRDGFVYVASGMWVWILGVGSYYLIPSLGPFYSAPQDFVGLPHTMIQDTQARFLTQRLDMLADPRASDAYAQISAFASLHVAVIFMILLMARYYGLRRTTRALTVFLVGTIVATIYLGWHFAVDDIAGLAIGWLSVALGRLMIYPRGLPPAPSSGLFAKSVGPDLDRAAPIQSAGAR
jgi:hypothetical protein